MGVMTISASSRGRIAGLDILRGLAIGLVLLRHAFPDTFGGAGIVGVVIFFALSGYLITGVLAKDIRTTGRVRYGRFYRNRALRLLPALLFLVAGYVVVSLTLDPLSDASTIPRTVIVALTYTSDVPGLFKGSDAMTHLWTLAVEEQFYLVWPAILVLAVRTKRTARVLILAGFALYLVCATSALLITPVERIYTFPTSWAVVMVMGALARIGQDRLASWLPAHGAARTATSWTALVTLVGVSLLPDAKNRPETYLLLGPLIGACTIVLIMHLRSWGSPPRGVWGRAALFLGTISYATYLWNLPVAAWSQAELGDGLAVNLSTIPATLVMATVSWYAVELPVQRRRERLDAKPSAPAVAERAPAVDQRA